MVTTRIYNTWTEVANRYSPHIVFLCISNNVLGVLRAMTTNIIDTSTNGRGVHVPIVRASRAWVESDVIRPIKAGRFSAISQEWMDDC